MKKYIFVAKTTFKLSASVIWIEAVSPKFKGEVQFCFWVFFS